MIEYIRESKIIGCCEIIPQVFKDERGLFIKTFHIDEFEEFGLVTDFKEEYYTVSARNVLRGLHFQIPPADHIKLVHCVSGKVMDVVVDLRIGSPTYGQYDFFELTDERPNMLYIPSGMAHGFYVLSERAIMLYKATTVYCPRQDSGIRWDSAAIPWPTKNPIISERDQGFNTLSEFKSPFVYSR